MDTLVYFGGAVKVLDESEGEVKVGGPLVVFGGSDLEGEFFTPSTYFGAQMKRSGEAVLDTMFNHGIATSDATKALAAHEFDPLTAKATDTGIIASVILKERDQYEKLVADLARKGKLGWSSGSAPHAVRKGDDGEIKRWPLIEGSLTHQPAEPRASIMPLKSLMQPATKEFFNEIEERIRTAFDTQYDFDQAWLQNASPTEVIYDVNGQLFRFGWRDEADGITFDARRDWQEVERETEYVPAKLLKSLQETRKLISTTRGAMSPSAPTLADVRQQIRTITHTLKA